LGRIFKVAARMTKAKAHQFAMVWGFEGCGSMNDAVVLFNGWQPVALISFIDKKRPASSGTMR